MQNINTTLQAGQATPFNVAGKTLQVISSGESTGLTIQFLQGSQIAYTVRDILTGWKLAPQGGFSSITIQSATADTIAAIVTNGDIDIQVLSGETQIVNSVANPVPVSIENATLAISASGVSIGNTAANPVPVAVQGTVPVSVAGAITLGNNAGVSVPVTGDMTIANTSANPAAVELTNSSVTVSNTAANPIPVQVTAAVSLETNNIVITNPASEPVPVAQQGAVTIGNTAAQPVPVSTVAGSALAINDTGAALRALAGQSFAGYANSTGASYNACQLWNPPSSGVNLYVQNVVGEEGNNGGEVIYMVGAQAELGTASPTSNGLNKLIGGAVSKGLLRTATQASLPTVGLLSSIGSPTSGMLNYPVSDPIVIPPGNGINVVCGTAAEAIGVNFEWYEQ